MNEYSQLLISGCLNKGAVSGENAAGFVSIAVTNTGTEITFRESANNGDITGEKMAEGFGYLFNEHYLILNCMNTGTIKSPAGACGLVNCAGNAYLLDYNYTILNSANKGLVSGGGMAFGIAPSVTTVSNVVSMGEVKAYIPYTFWRDCFGAQMFYGMKDKCESCDICESQPTLFKANGKKYKVVETGEYVHEVLNNEVEKKQYTIKWTSQLNLAGNGFPSSSSGALHILSPLLSGMVFFTLFLAFV